MTPTWGGWGWGGEDAWEAQSMAQGVQGMVPVITRVAEREGRVGGRA